jgi:hypothetical protein
LLDDFTGRGFCRLCHLFYRFFFGGRFLHGLGHFFSNLRCLLDSFGHFFSNLRLRFLLDNLRCLFGCLGRFLHGLRFFCFFRRRLGYGGLFLRRLGYFDGRLLWPQS